MKRRSRCWTSSSGSSGSTSRGRHSPGRNCPEGGTRTSCRSWKSYCRKLDLYFSFAKAFGCPVDEEALYDRREEAEEINEILLHRLKNNIRLCQVWGGALHHHGRLCEACYRKQRRR